MLFQEWHLNVMTLHCATLSIYGQDEPSQVAIYVELACGKARAKREWQFSQLFCKFFARRMVSLRETLPFFVGPMTNEGPTRSIHDTVLISHDASVSRML